MTVAEVERKLVEKYPAYLKETSELADIIQFLGRFGEDEISKIWEAFRMTYAFASAPRLAVFNTAATNSGARMRGGDAKKYEFVCYVCGARFILSLTTCPKCGNHDKNWRAVIAEGGYRGGRLKGEVEDERDRIHREINR